MANPTTNYGWPMPTSADLVTDLPADFALFGQPVDTSLKALNPETTLGDIAYRSATSNTNTRLGIGTNGQVLAVSGGVPAWTTTADVTPLTTKGDLFTFDTADARLGVGTNGQTLVADSTASTGLKWATASSSAIVYLGQGTLSAATSATLDSVFTATYRNYLLYFDYTSAAGSDVRVTFRAGGVDDTTGVYYSTILYGAGGSAGSSNSSAQTSAKIGGGGATYGGLIAATIYAPQATAQKRIESRGHKDVGANAESHIYNAGFVGTTAFDGIKISTATSTLTGTFRIYGIVNS